MTESRRYTLLVPTYNRPDDLGRLLRLLAHQNADFPIHVLDSSADEVFERNRATAKALPLDLHVERYLPAMQPFEKFWRGAQNVRTEFASLCADDDLILTASIAPLIERLTVERDACLAHGWYFYFYLQGSRLGLTGIAYRGASLDAADPLARLHQLFRNYEALTYGIYRTPILCRILAAAQSVETMLGRELLGGALAMVAGKALRLPILYSGRSHGPSIPYADWQPLNFLIDAPQRLFEDYQRSRAEIFAYYRECGHGAREDLAKLVDLAHLRYLSQYFTPETLDYFFEETWSGATPEQLAHSFWWTRQSGLRGVLQRGRLFQRLSKRLLRWLRRPELARIRQPFAHRTLHLPSANGADRAYYVRRTFDKQLGDMAADARAEDLIRVLAGYA